MEKSACPGPIVSKGEILKGQILQGKSLDVFKRMMRFEKEHKLTNKAVMGALLRHRQDQPWIDFWTNREQHWKELERAGGGTGGEQ